MRARSRAAPPSASDPAPPPSPPPSASDPALRWPPATRSPLPSRHPPSSPLIPPQVRYPSLENEMRVGEVYLRLLLDGSPKTLQIHAPGRFINELYYRLLWERRRDIRLLCMQGMAITYQTYFEQIGPFPDIGHVVLMLRETFDRTERDRLLMLIRALLASTPNAKKLMACGGLEVLLELLITVHLESERSAHSQVLGTAPFELQSISH